MEINLIILSFLVYLFGSIPFGYIIPKIFGFGDIRNIGSGNVGATNVLRTGKKSLASAVLILDILKGFLPFFPNIRLSFVYQYTLFYLNKLFEKPSALLPYISRQYKFDMAFDQIQTAVRTYESYLRSFCFIALAHGITPILVNFHQKKRKTYPIFVVCFSEI